MPGFIKPQLATLKAKAPSGDQWLHEIKFDGYRVQLHLNKGKKRVFTRNGLDWTKRFSVIAGALDIPGQAILDGEVVVIHEGRTNFSELQAELAAGNRTGWSTTRSTCSGGTAISGNFLRWSASECSPTCSGKTTSGILSSIPST
jgi:ATP-dependent DNA ligase